MPTSDQVMITDRHPFKGVLTGDTFIFRARDGKRHTIPYAHICSIHLRHTWLFSDYDPITIFFTDTRFQEFKCVDGTIHMTDLGGKSHLHRLRKVEKS